MDKFLYLQLEADSDYQYSMYLINTFHIKLLMRDTQQDPAELTLKIEMGDGNVSFRKERVLECITSDKNIKRFFENCGIKVQYEGKE